MFKSLQQDGIDLDKMRVEYNGRGADLAKDLFYGSGDVYHETVDETSQRMSYYHDDLGQNWLWSITEAGVGDPLLGATGVKPFMEGVMGNSTTGEMFNTEERWERGAMGFSQMVMTGVTFMDSLSWIRVLLQEPSYPHPGKEGNRNDRCWGFRVEQRYNEWSTAFGSRNQYFRSRIADSCISVNR